MYFCFSFLSFSLLEIIKVIFLLSFSPYSFKTFGEIIISIVFSVYPMCRIFNLLSGKQILICDNKDNNKNSNSIFIKPFES